jgi:hypothetical protein
LTEKSKPADKILNVLIRSQISYKILDYKQWYQLIWIKLIKTVVLKRTV